jgi:hypothetical protein
MFFTIDLISFLPLISLDLTEHQEKLLIASNQLSSLPEIIGGLEFNAPATQHSSYSIKCANFLRSAQKEILTITGLLLFYGLLLLKREGKFVQKMLTSLGPLIGKVLQVFMVDLLVKACLFSVFVRVGSFQAVLSWIFFVVCFFGISVSAYKLVKEALNADVSPLFQHPELKS